MTWDVVVVGGGPAGSTTAALLAADGHRVLVVEKEKFPRFHIGESLLPIDLPIFDRLGFRPERGPFLKKAGAEFVDERRGKLAVYQFEDGLRGTPAWAWQVDRATFDHALLVRAREAGAEVREGEKVVDIEHDDVRAIVRTAAGSAYEARYCVDATGQDAFLARRAHTVDPIKGFGIAAVFAHFDQLSEEVWHELEETGRGNIKVLILSEAARGEPGTVTGWSWLIPIHRRRLSFGVVTSQPGVSPELLDEVAATSPLIQRLSRGATRTEPRIIRNFSYKNRVARGVRWACVGDAACFLDPVFSSGVSLAMTGGEHLAAVLGPALREGREADPDLAAAFEQRMKRAYDSFASLIHSFYNTRIVEHLFFCDEPDPEMRAGLITVLAGDVWRDDNRFQNALLSGRRRWDAE
jgi:flavin-dependent dehydrogenase